MATTIIRPTTREAWLEIRQKGIGSSEVASILGLNPYESPYQLWRRKTGIDGAKTETFAMRAGHYLEDAVSRFWEDETGKTIIKRSASDWLIRDNDRPFLQVSPDRTYWLGESRSPEKKGILECKTTQMEVDEDNVPQHWFCQLQYQLGVAGLESGSLAWLTMGRQFGYREFQFDKDFFAYMIEEVCRFWSENIVGGQEPPLYTADDVLLKSPRHIAGKCAEASEELVQKCAELQGIKSELAKLNARKSDIEDVIKMAIGDAEALVAKDGNGGNPHVLATWKAAKNSMKFNEKAFAADDPALHARYQTVVQGSRRLLVK